MLYEQHFFYDVKLWFIYFVDFFQVLSFFLDFQLRLGDYCHQNMKLLAVDCL